MWNVALLARRPVAVVVAALTLVGCGSSEGLTPAADADLEPSAVLDSMASKAAEEGWVASATRPGGGAVLVAAARSEEGRQEFDRSGVVIDELGNAVLTFELPVPVFVLAQVATDDRAHLVGIVCVGWSSESDDGQRDCRPGRVVGYSVDLETGIVTDLSVPSEVVERGAGLAGLPIALVSGGAGAVFLVASVDPPTHEVWRLDGTLWEAAGSAPGLPCRVGGRVVYGSSSKAADGAWRATTDVLDESSGRWKQYVGPSFASRDDLAPTVVCTRERLVHLVHGQPPASATMVAFDPGSTRWDSWALPAVSGVDLPIGTPGLRPVLLFEMTGDGEQVDPVAVDPATGRVGNPLPDLQLGSFLTFVPLSPNTVLAISRGGSTSVEDLST